MSEDAFVERLRALIAEARAAGLSRVQVLRCVDLEACVLQFGEVATDGGEGAQRD